MSYPNGNAPNSPPAPPTQNDPAARFQPLALLLAGLEGIITAFLIGKTRSVEGSVLFGLSAFRLAMVSVILLGSAVFLGLAWQWRRKPRLAARLQKTLTKRAAVLAFVFFWGAVVLFLFALKPYFMVLLGTIQAIDTEVFYQRLAPFSGWSALILIQFSLAVVLDHRDLFSNRANTEQPLIAWLVLLITGRPNRHSRKGRGSKRSWQSILLPGLVWLAMLAAWAIAGLTGVGLIPDDRFWNVAGVPVLPQQIVLSGLALLFLVDLKTSASKRKMIRLTQRRFYPYLVMAALWAAAVLVWQAADMQHTYFAPGPYPPNMERYPFSDARWFDTGGQYALIGEGLYNNATTDRPFMMLYTALLHLLGGQQYDQFIFVQLAFLALIPAAMFALGWRLDSKTAGLGMALLVIFKERNAIEAATEIGLVNAKVLMSELPTALLLILMTLYLFRWLKFRQQPSLLAPIFAGGLLGLAAGFRVNTLALLPVGITYIFLGMLSRRKGWLKHWVGFAGLFAVSLALVLAPYSYRSYQQSGSAFWWDKIQNVVERSTEESALPQSGKPGQTKLIQPGSEESFLAQTAADQETVLSYSLKHFVHNEITSVLILPLNWQVTPLNEMVEKPRWDYDQIWQGELTTGEKIAVGINLLILSVGVSAAFRRWRFAGLTPLAIHLGYHLSNAVSRTSGGRYLVPVDWVVLAYFVLGLLSIYFSARGWRPALGYGSEPPRRPARLFTIIGLLLGCLLLGSAFMLADLVQPKYPPNSAEAILTEQFAQRPEWFTENGISARELEAFVNSDLGVVELGLILYPRYYPADEPAPRSSYLPVMPAGQNRITFLLLEEYQPRYVRLALGEGYPNPFPHAVYGLVVGCHTENYIEGKLIIPLGETEQEPILSDRLSLICSAP